MTALYVYPDRFGNTAKSFKALCIYRNTLLCRIRKIKEILHCELENGEEIYQIIMPLRIIRILGLYPLPAEYEAQY